MKRWFALFLLLASCSGCMLFDDDRYDEAPYGWAAQPSSSCAAPPPIVNVSQTIEPPH